VLGFTAAVPAVPVTVLLLRRLLPEVTLWPYCCCCCHYCCCCLRYSSTATLEERDSQCSAQGQEPGCWRSSSYDDSSWSLGKSRFG
jgi:hypothetical protein